MAFVENSYCGIINNMKNKTMYSAKISTWEELRSIDPIKYGLIPKDKTTFFGSIAILGNSLRTKIFSIFSEFFLDVETRSILPLHQKSLQFNLPMKNYWRK